jgi:Bacterial regulatory protein, Fis family
MTMWKAWIGFHVSHSMGLLLFVCSFGYLSVCRWEERQQSYFLIGLGLLVLGDMLSRPRVYWFTATLIWVSAATLRCRICLGVCTVLRKASYPIESPFAIVEEQPLDDDRQVRAETAALLKAAQFLATLKETGGVLSGRRGAARLLGIHRSTLQFRMKKLGIERCPSEYELVRGLGHQPRSTIRARQTDCATSEGSRLEMISSGQRITAEPTLLERLQGSVPFHCGQAPSSASRRPSLPFRIMIAYTASDPDRTPATRRPGTSREKYPAIGDNQNLSDSQVK